MDNYIQPIEELDFNEWNTPVEKCVLYNFRISVVYRGKIYNEFEWEMSDEKKEYDLRKQYEHNQRYYRNKKLPTEIDPDYKQKQIVDQFKTLIDKSLNKPIEKTVYIDNSIRTKISIF